MTGTTRFCYCSSNAPRGKQFLQGRKSDCPFFNGYFAPFRLPHKFLQPNQLDKHPYHHLCHHANSSYNNMYVLVKPMHHMKDVHTEAKARPSTACTTTTGTT